jgi:RNA polymerase sigma-70 factor (ECF subfamily)
LLFEPGMTNTAQLARRFPDDAAPNPRLREAFPQDTLALLPELRRAARRYAGRRGDLADDLVQETFLRAFAAQHRFRQGSNARAWMHTILLNAARTEHRRHRREQHLQERYAAEPIDPAPASGSAPAPSLMAIVARLPRPFREAIELVDLGGLSYQEAAERLGCPIGTVMSRLHRARRALRTALERLPEAGAAAATVGATLGGRRLDPDHQVGREIEPIALERFDRK